MEGILTDTDMFFLLLACLILCPLGCRSDVVPRLSYASVEGIFMELVSASPVRRAANDVKNRSVCKHTLRKGQPAAFEPSFW